MKFYISTIVSIFLQQTYTNKSTKLVSTVRSFNLLWNCPLRYTNAGIRIQLEGEDITVHAVKAYWNSGGIYA